jgi:hypothetical protein
MTNFLTKIMGSKRGETIMETVIALSILAIGLTFSSVLISSSLRNISISKNRVIAVNIAREGIEAVRNIRDTNWLKFSGRRRTCWNNRPQDDMGAECNGGTPINAGEYVVYKAEDGRWRLEEFKKTVPPDDPFDNSILYTVDIDPDTDTNRDGDKTNDSDMYNHRLSNDNDDNDALGRANAVATPFTRIIKIEYLANDGTAKISGIPTDAENRMRVTSTVKWTRGAIEHTVELKTHLTDYLGRDDLGS